MKQLCQQFNLGDLQQAPRLVKGGCSHQLYHVQTNQGEYAVKALNPAVVAFLGGIEKYQQRESLVKIIARNNIPAVAALHVSDTHMVYPWIAGEVCALPDLTQQQLEKIATILAQLQQLNIVDHNLDFAPWQYLPETDWSEYFSAAELATVQKYDVQYRKAWLSLTGQEVLSHGDLNHLNVLWQNDKPHIVDWESLGWAYPKAEFLSLALSWCGFVSDEFNQQRFDCMRNVYCAAQSSVWFTQQDLDASLGYWLIWLKFCRQRVMGQLPCEKNQLAFYQQSVVKTFAVLDRTEGLSRLN